MEEMWSGAITGFACLHNPAHIERGAVYRFNVNHVVLPHSVDEMFRHAWVETQAESDAEAGEKVAADLVSV
jgi:hypothetical protein